MLPEHLAIKNTDHETALSIAFSMEKHENCKNLVDHMLPGHYSITDKNGNTALITAINGLSKSLSRAYDPNNRQLYNVKYLTLNIISRTPPENLSITNNNGKTALMEMAGSDIIRYHPRIIEAILEKNPSNQAEIQRADGKTALTFALEFFKTKRTAFGTPLHGHIALIQQASRPSSLAEDDKPYTRYLEIAHEIMRITSLQETDPQLFKEVSNNINEQKFIPTGGIGPWNVHETPDQKKNRVVGRLAVELYEEVYYVNSLQAIIRKLSPEQIRLNNSEHFSLLVNNIKPIELEEAKKLLTGDIHTNTFYFREASTSIILNSFIQASYQ